MFSGFWINKSSWPPPTKNHIVWIYLLFLCFFSRESFTNFNARPICEYNNWRILPLYFWWRNLYVSLHNSSSSFKYTFGMLFAISFFTFFLFCLRLIVDIFFCAHSTPCFLLPVAYRPMFTHSVIFIFINFISIFHTMLFNYIRCIGYFFYFLNIIINCFAFAFFMQPGFLFACGNFFSCEFFLAFLVFWWFEGCPSLGLV